MLVATPLRLRDVERAALEDMAGSASRHSSLALRAQIVLRAAEGAPNTVIARDLGVSRPTVIAWRQRYAESGLAGLRDLPRPGRPRDIDETLVVAATFTRPPRRSAAPHWSTRTLSATIGASHSSIADVWRRWRLRPDGASQPAVPSDPPLAPWVRDVVGIYLNPPEYALAVITDSAAALPTIDELLAQTSADARPTRRNDGLLQAMAFASERLVENCPPSLAHEELLEFLIGVVRGYPRRPVHVLLRTTSSIEHPETRYWLARHPSVHVHLATESPDWFAVAHVLMSFAALSAGDGRPIETSKEIVDAMRSFADDWDDNRAHFSWHEPLASPRRRLSSALG